MRPVEWFFLVAFALFASLTMVLYVLAGIRWLLPHTGGWEILILSIILAGGFAAWKSIK
jgi:hypothetical protein